jgi:hypothetical protein
MFTASPKVPIGRRRSAPTLSDMLPAKAEFPPNDTSANTATTSKRFFIRNTPQRLLILDGESLPNST